VSDCATLLLTRSDVAALLDMRECIDAVEKAFRLCAEGKAGILSVHRFASRSNRSATLRRPYREAISALRAPRPGASS